MAPIFGLISSLDPTVGHVTFIGFIFLLILLDFLIRKLEHAAEIRGFKDLFEKLKTELMLMGILSFIIFINQIANFATADVVLSFEMTHMIIFFLALAFIIQAAFLVTYASTSGNRYLAALRTSSESLFVQYKLMKTKPYHSFWFHHGSSLLPKFGFRTDIEFRIVERLFIFQHNLPHNFNFAHYVNQLFKVVAFLNNLIALLQYHLHQYYDGHHYYYCCYYNCYLSIKHLAKFLLISCLTYTIP